MLTTLAAFGGFSVDDIDAAATFYRDALGLDVSLNDMGILELTLPGGARVIAYPKADHAPASFTILNFVVADVSVAVGELNAAGITTKIYDDDQLPTDENGIMRGNGPTIAWFRDPANNVLSVIEE
ncbi:catechol 2,3-dioxygenase-like lactoylglutathione lyase family enzyme [Okibacterium sp. HSC-33S16]|uniref:VOC family protein n=1 Tax=Okibacterium sp. HSC-33S16 TaxID=2910965 RepID=UPI00209F9C65|nr:VOC family protein [Okibacterium sp. HSC-33S16]MCP2032718.1 catechol 2,3-dioxygenase-like lactoylglutathione lyase family enzyme [Okibacterium sp. HSC-33S16]